MSYHRLRVPTEIDGVMRPVGYILVYSGPPVHYLEPLDPVEHSRWIEAGFGPAWRPPLVVIEGGLGRPKGEPSLEPPAIVPAPGRALIQGMADFMIVGGLIAATLAPLVLLVECFEWVTSSEWPGLTVADGLALFGLSRELPEDSAQRLIDLLFAIPLTLALFLTGLFTFLAGINLGDWGVVRDIERNGLRD